jgi:NADPH:quinone reductase-like Zn-dependent oxidoreductase
VLVTARPDDEAACVAAGAAAVVDYRDPDVAAQVRRLAPDGVDVHLDTAGRHDLDAALAVVGRGGRIVLMAGLFARPELPVGAVYTGEVTIVGFAISNARIDDLAAGGNSGQPGTRRRAVRGADRGRAAAVADGAGPSDAGGGRGPRPDRAAARRSLTGLRTSA